MGCSLCSTNLSALEELLRENAAEVDSHPMSDRWMKEWSAGVCEFQGLEPGTTAFERCRVKQVEKVLSSPARASAIRGAATARAAIDSEKFY
jgi:hypothetical protein